MYGSNALSITPLTFPEYDIMKGRGAIDKSSDISYRVLYTKENEGDSDKQFKTAIFKDLHRHELITDSQLRALLEALRQE